MLFVSRVGVPCGAVASLLTLLEHLEGRCQRYVAVPAGSWLAETVPARGLAEEVLEMKEPRLGRWTRPLAAARLAWVARRRGLRLRAIHVNGLAELNLAAPLALLARVRLVVWVHDYQITPWARRIAPRIGRALQPRFVGVSDWSHDQLVEAGIPSELIEVVPNPIDVRAVVAAHVPSPLVRVAFLGLPRHYKGFHLLPTLLAHLAGAPMVLKVYADEDDPETIPEVWRSLRAREGPTLELHPRLGSVAPAYAESDIVVCPSLQESFGRVAAEAMANGLPVVAFDLPALRQVIGSAGVLVPPGDVVAFAEALEALVADPALRAVLGDSGRQRAAAFAPEPVLARFSELFGL